MLGEEAPNYVYSNEELGDDAETPATSTWTGVVPTADISRCLLRATSHPSCLDPTQLTVLPPGRG